MNPESKKILIIAATEFEIAPTLHYLQNNWQLLSPCSFKKVRIEITIQLCGIGLVATTFNLSKCLMQERFDVVLQLGIAGAYPNSNLQLGNLVQVIKDRIADLGAIDADGKWLQLSDMNLTDLSGEWLSAAIPAFLNDNFQNIPTAIGLSVNCVSGNKDAIHNFELPDSAIVIESMEGAALHYVCGQLNIPNIQIRSISNWVTKRDKSSWQMPLAIENLNNWAIDFLSNIS